MASLSTSNIRPKPWESRTMNEESLPNNDHVFNLSSIAKVSKKVTFQENKSGRNDVYQEHNDASDNGRNEAPEIPNPLPANMFNQNHNNYDDLDRTTSNWNSINQNSSLPGYLNSAYSGTLNGFRNNFNSPYNNNMYEQGNPYSYNNMNGSNMNNSTESTFQLIEGVIGAIGGFAQMLESTYVATHNSFFTLLSIAEQFNYLKEVFGSALGIFFFNKVYEKILNIATHGTKGLPSSKNELKSSMIKEFVKFQQGINERRRHKISWKPLLLFLFSIVGLPYILNRVISKLQTIESSHGVNEKIDLSNLEFARALFDFNPENRKIELTLTKGDLMAILTKKDPYGNTSKWWKVRTKNGDTGYVPSNYIEIIPRNKTKIKVTATE
ncbi:hypothetical protein TPHA_0F03100 [Tetrapisispora phaffii CBS 4417]|uniref:Peroxisomal membrane protein PEX13 n=1 Tax=Tetrapisispora phaffii (strain ATCC 24235 / CBS 4417 / NBRC 1672 / NRRL Y-8282 / UCD 70-5) TaxID=1071381 RepID=G8BUK5_TETPH|nr:hypothetical protein TPHA_0F03100 [Tetrapisispora phaffii CBS 4417]CCE63791.1 hypothetical protein TPHA_0F03100 [Tetrapisispora phaffii CBS 4417]